ncbi:putative replication initiation/membrane attachment protein DnaB [Mycoplasmoides gallisepticum CA06_2006.052-5-2P]|uniref:Replication initiation/membrane attachment protein DnaB n=5 Tax=Mycoplasmoides gallisepticum TaxID=2096 RepID=Q7NBN2_MYCGA|nr:putative replication initiation/membrane attachment protein DnaB [Mycoplasmoides gallisepticum str. R(low)]ADC30435.1 putative replication initiation/membrane attachment protein DnaB [Mycoplasmoides gallisepticum str. R(high)]ADC31529.1 putative replication initiation/membrane attachment protein DnaB [Mycoplasmoides gallisepticum str. F]AFP75855.1 putative replication initiation/membrane attachment protein DnaB [Mycoplasmoides gallisepticum VA94_7994-1-7P]AFP76622.1 putative replication init
MSMVDYEELYEIHKMNGGVSDFGLITNVYIHILGPQATMFYIWLLNDHQIYLNERWKKNNLPLSRILTSLNISKKQLIDFRNLLEGMSLIKTYKEEKTLEKQLIYKFCLAKMLDWDSLVSQEEIKNRIIAKIGHEEYFRLSSLYSNKNIGGSNVNVSSTFHQVYKSNNNTDQISHIVKPTKTLVDIDNLNFGHFEFSPETKTALVNLCERYNPTEAEIKNIISTTDDINDTFELTRAITNYTKEIDQVEDDSIPKNMARNESFYSTFCPSDLEIKILREYRTMNSEKYLRGIYRRNLFAREVELVEKIKKEHDNREHIVNAILDFAAHFTLTDQIQFEYVEKISNTLKLKNISRLNDAVKFFRKTYYSKKNANIKFELQKRN